MSARYRMVKLPEHPRATRNGFVYEHVLVAERAIGRLLPSGAQVHHVNEDTRDNSPSNLVVCEDDAYHKLLHVRARALDACGNAEWRKCCMCKRYDDTNNLKSKQSGTTGRSFYHDACAARYQRSLKAGHGGTDITRDEAESNTAHYLAMGQPMLYGGAA